MKIRLPSIAGAICCGLVACAPVSFQTERRVDDIFFASQHEADEALSKFGIDYPDCQVWTNWQKMCSHLGPNREVVCVTDTKFRVSPSTPFCSGITEWVEPTATRPSPYGFTILSNTGHPERMRSAHRFCRSKVARQTDGSGIDYYCGDEGHSDNRPFSRPFWAFERTKSRLSVVNQQNVSDSNYNYGDYYAKMKTWCNVPIEYDVSQSEWKEVIEIEVEGIMRVRHSTMSARFREYPVVGIYCRVLER